MTTEKHERALLMSTEDVRAVLAGKLTQLTRVVEPQPERINAAGHPETFKSWHGIEVVGEIASPFGKPGDALWVREAVWLLEDPTISEGPPAIVEGRGLVLYRTEMSAPPPTPVEGQRWVAVTPTKMPRWACRLLLRVTELRCLKVCEEGPWTWVADFTPEMA